MLRIVRVARRPLLMQLLLCGLTPTCILRCVPHAAAAEAVMRLCCSARSCDCGPSAAGSMLVAPQLLNPAGRLTLGQQDKFTKCVCGLPHLERVDVNVDVNREVKLVQLTAAYEAGYCIAQHSTAHQQYSAGQQSLGMDSSFAAAA
jgi:hypothetical protein